MTRSDLVDAMARALPQLPLHQVEEAVKRVFERMLEALEQGERIELRGFGSFMRRYRTPRAARNPKTGERVQVEGKYVLHFKAGKEFRERLNTELGEQLG